VLLIGGQIEPPSDRVEGGYFLTLGICEPFKSFWLAWISLSLILTCGLQKVHADSSFSCLLQCGPLISKLRTGQELKLKETSRYLLRLQFYSIPNFPQSIHVSNGAQRDHSKEGDTWLWDLMVKVSEGVSMTISIPMWVIYLGEFWGKLFDFHGQLIELARLKDLTWPYG